MSDDNIISIAERSERKNAPDAEHVCIMAENGSPVKWFRYGAEFTADGGKTFGFDFWAKGDADAAAIPGRKSRCLHSGGSSSIPKRQGSQEHGFEV